MADAKNLPLPKVGKTALELLDSKYALPQSLSQKYSIQVFMGLCGAGIHVLKNWAYRRPMIAGAYLYPIYFVGGAVAGQFLKNYRENYFAERDAVLRHYIQLHPEDFPPPDRKKYGEIMLEWVPCR